MAAERIRQPLGPVVEQAGLDFSYPQTALDSLEGSVPGSALKMSFSD